MAKSLARGEKKSLTFLRQMKESREYELWLGAMQRAEIVFFMTEEEENITLHLLSQFSPDMLCIAGTNGGDPDIEKLRSQLIGRDDRALYYYKEHGRNRVTHIDDSP